MANKFFGSISLIGGTDGALDKIDDSVISDGDGGFVITDTERVHVYHMDSGSGAAEDSPRIIAPDSGSNKRWLLATAVVQSLMVYENAEYVYGVTSADAEQGLLRINSSDDTEVRAISGQSVDIIVDAAKVADFSATGITLAAGGTISEFSTDGTLAGNVDTAVPTERAVKTYVDTQLTAEDLDFAGDTGTGAVDLDSQSLTVAGGTGLASVAGSQTVTLNIDSTVTTLTGSQTLTNKTLTSPIINTILAKAGETGIAIAADGAVDLYYDNAKVVETISEGINFGTSTQSGTLKHGGTNLNLKNTLHGGSVVLQAEDTAGSLKSLFVGDPDAAATLYFGGTQRCATHSTGITIGAQTAAQNTEVIFDTVAAKAGRLAFNLAGVNQWLLGQGAASETDAFELYNADGTMVISVAKATSLITLGGGLSSAGSVDLYHAGTKAFATSASGAQIHDTTTDDPLLEFMANTAARQGWIQFKAGVMSIYDDINDDYLIRSNAAGSVDLYYAGTKVCTTEANGILLGSAQEGRIQHTGSTFQFYSFDHGGPFDFQAEDASGSAQRVMYGDPDGSTELYYAGVKYFHTIANGVSITNGTGILDIYSSADIHRIYSYNHGWPILFQGEDAGGTAKSIFNGDPDGAAELYHAGVKVAYTGATGFYIDNPSGAALFRMYESSTLTAEMQVSSGAVYLDNKIADGDIYIRTGSENMIHANGGGAVRLYYDGTLSVESTVVNSKPGIKIGNCPILSGTGSPESVVTAAVGSLYLRDDGGAGTTLYVKESGAGNTGWSGV